MKRLEVALVLLAIAAALAFAAGSTEADSRGEGSEKEAIEALWAEYGSSRTDGDAELRNAIHHPEAIKMPQDAPPFRWADVAKSVGSKWATQDESGVTEMEVVPTETVVMGEYAYSMGHYTKRVTPKDGGKSSAFEGKFLTILRKDEDGNWLVYRDSYSSNNPPEVDPVLHYSFGAPVNLGTDVNSEGSEGSPRISADGLELYFHSNRPGGFGGTDLWVARRPSVNADWGRPVNLGSTINTAGNELAPTISADGLELYFCDFMAPRPWGLGESDLWVSRRPNKNASWEAPENLGPRLNTAGQEITPEISADGLELYFETDRPGSLGSDDLWVSKRRSVSAPWGAPLWLGPEINTKGMDHCPNITSDGLVLYFDRTPPGETLGDLMVVHRASLEDAWGEPINLGRSISGHCASSISPDGGTLYYTSSYPGGVGGNDIWKVPVFVNGEALAP